MPAFCASTEMSLALGQHLQLVRRFYQAERGEGRRGIDRHVPDVSIPQLREQDLRSGGRLARSRAVHRQRQLRPSGTECVEQCCRLLLIDRRAVGLAAQHRADEPVERVGREHGRNAGPGACLVAAEQPAGPVLTLRILVLDEQHLAARRISRQQYQRRVFLGDPGQVIEVAVLPVLVVHIT